MGLRVHEWMRLPGGALCSVCGRHTNAWNTGLAEPMHFECSSMGVTGRRHYEPWSRRWRSQFGDLGRRWSPWGSARELPNRHHRPAHLVERIRRREML